MRHIESLIQKECVKWFRLQYPELLPLLFSVPNGGARGKTEARILYAEGEIAGVSDCILLAGCKGYTSLCVEFKTGASYSRQSPLQKAWQVAAEKAGSKYVICRNFEDFRNEITTYLPDRKSEQYRQMCDNERHYAREYEKQQEKKRSRQPIHRTHSSTTGVEQMMQQLKSCTPVKIRSSELAEFLSKKK